VSGGWKGSNRSEELPPDWPAIRRHILDRDGGRCQQPLPSGAPCPNPATDVDHVGSKWDHGDDNLQSLCGVHHNRKTAAQGNAGRAQRPKLVKRQRGGPAPGDGWA